MTISPVSAISFKATLIGAVLAALSALAHEPGEGTPLAVCLSHGMIQLAEGPVAGAGVQTRAIVAAAQAFLATLADEQRDAVLFDASDDAQRMSWTNFPEGGMAPPRGGVAWVMMDDTRRGALLAMLGTLLGPKGWQNAIGQMAADDVAAAADAAGIKDEGRPPVRFGSDCHFVSLECAPSVDTPFQIQFGGHHQALKAMVAGGEPLKFTHDGKDVHLTADEAEAAAALVSSLDADQRAKAVQSDALGDLQL